MTKIFGTDGIRCLVNQEPLTAENCLKISKSVAYTLLKKKHINPRVVISKDTRLSGYLYEPILTGGFISMGFDVILIGPLPTPSVPLMIKTLNADIGVMITASHNTYEYNGLKFFNSNGLKLNNVTEKKVEEIVFDKNKYYKVVNKKYDCGKALRMEDAAARYSEHLKTIINKKIKTKKFKIILDCANGATYNIAPNLFWELGHNVISINSTPNGKNINKNCGSVDISELKKNVIKNKADIGFAFDGDGDRIICIDEKGNSIDGDKILALFAKHYIYKKSKKPIISTVMSNLGFENYIKNKLKIPLIRTKVGDINVISKMKEKKSLLGGEQSGHIILSKHSNTGDGILAALKIIEIMSMKEDKASKIFDLYKELPQKKINISFKKIKKENIKKINSMANLKEYSKKGYRNLIRFSGTEPIIRILVEGASSNEVDFIAKKIEKKIRSYIV